MKILPELCYSVLNLTGEVIIIKRDENGYYRTCCGSNDKSENMKLKDYYNDRLGVTQVQEECMKIGSMFGWDVPGANPNNYDKDGRFIMREE